MTKLITECANMLLFYAYYFDWGPKKVCFAEILGIVQF